MIYSKEISKLSLNFSSAFIVLKPFNCFNKVCVINGVICMANAGNNNLKRSLVLVGMFN